MLSINTNVSNYYIQNNTSMRTVSSTSTTTNTEHLSGNKPLTDDELNLAKEYNKYLNFNDALFRLSKGEADELDKEVLSKDKQSNRFDNVLNAIGVQIFDTSNLFIDITQRPDYNLPNQNYHFDASNNSVQFGIGSKIPLGSSYLHVYDNIVSNFPAGYQQNLQDNDMKILMGYNGDKDASALNELIYGVTQGNANWSNNIEMNNSILSLLNKMGVDTTKDFKINNVIFEVKSGIVQTKGYNASKEETSGLTYLQDLLTKAYEQNLM